jgi:DNA polymerase-3 subunit alpha
MSTDARPFAHLHVHTHYSMLDGASKVPDLVARTKELGMSALAITDHGVMYGAIEFYNECVKAGIKPLVGVEAYLAPGNRREKSTPTGNAGDAAFHLLLLAQNLTGYRNLLKLSKIAFTEGFYYKPRIDKEVLKEFSEGLICTSACLGGEVASAFLKKDAKIARNAAETYLEIFGPDRFFIEVQSHIDLQNQTNPELIELAKKLGVGVVATNDVHFLKKDDYFAHNCLCCISTQKLADDPNRMIYPEQLFLRSPAEMWECFKHVPEAIDNTMRIASMCDLQLDFSKRYAPVYRVAPEKLDDAMPLPSSPTPREQLKDDERYLRELCERGLDWRYGTRDVGPDVRARLEYELKVIASKNFCSYFLIVWDFCNYAREHGIPVGARGSGVGTMVGYLLGLCNVDPLRYGLLFERFMDPSRSEMPDIDIDICQDGRQKVIEYVRNKYGHVAQIVTFGTLAAKAACKDVGRVLGVDLGLINKMTGLIPGTPGMTINKAIDQVPDLRSLIELTPDLQRVVETARKLEGLCRNAGVHAAGVIIADQPLDELVPLCKDKEGNLLTQFEGPIAEKVGLLKMDFLGLRTLSVITRACELVKQSRGIEIDIEGIDLTDKRVLDLFCRGETRGIFQFESGGMQDLLLKMQPDRLEDLIAANALYRPGPMELIPTYCNRKHGREKVPEVHPIMDSILAETYGIMCYQEQVMQVFNQLGGIELSAAYKLIKAISKKQTDVIAKYKPDFIKGTVAKGVSQDKAEELFDLILKFGGYGFNKSHSTRYAILAFQTGYLKSLYPVEYMSALLTYEMGSTDKVVEYIDETRRMKIPVLPPDVNESGPAFTPVVQREEDTKRKRDAAKSPSLPPGVIRFGLAAVRGVGEKAVEAIVHERTKSGKFTHLFEFCDRVDTRSVQKSTLDALIRCGAFSSVHNNRAAMLHALDGAFESAHRTQQDKLAGQSLLFGGGGGDSGSKSPAVVVLPNVPEFSRPELLQMEKDLLGFYVSSHPLTEHRNEVEAFASYTTKMVLTAAEGTEVTLAGMIAQVRTRVAKTGRSAGQRWAIVEFEDLEGKIEGILFAESFAALTAKKPDLLVADRVVLINGTVDRKREVPCLMLRDVMPIEEAAASRTTGVVAKLDAASHELKIVSDFHAMVAKHRGGVDLGVFVKTADGKLARIKLPRQFKVRPSKEFVAELEGLLGRGSVELLGPGSGRRAKQQQMFEETVADASPGDLEPALMEAELVSDLAE